MATVREVNDIQELTSLGQIWNRLLRSTPGASFFQSLEWLQVYWKHFGAHKRLRVLVVEDGSRIIGILPLIVQNARRSEPIRALTYPLNNWSHFYGPIGPNALATVIAGLDHIHRTPRDWHFIELNYCDTQCDGGSTMQAFQNAGLTVECDARYETAVVDLAAHGSWDAYCSARSRRWRSNVRYYDKKLAAQGEVEYVRHRSEAPGSDPRWDLYEACNTISQASWQHYAKGNALTKQEYLQYYHDCHQAAADFGALDMNLLFVGGRPAAFSYQYHLAGHVTGVNTAFDPAVSSQGTGRVLQARVIADSFLRGDTLYDLGTGSQDWKQIWLTGVRPIHRYTHFPRRALMAQLVRAKRAIERPLRAGPAKNPVAAET